MYAECLEIERARIFIFVVLFFLQKRNYCCLAMFSALQWNMWKDLFVSVKLIHIQMFCVYFAYEDVVRARAMALASHQQYTYSLSLSLYLSYLDINYRKAYHVPSRFITAAAINPNLFFTNNIYCTRA